MRTERRSDGTTYLVSNRTVYGAIAYFPLEIEKTVQAQLKKYVDALNCDEDLDIAVQELPSHAHSCAKIAGNLIRVFDSSTNFLSKPSLDLNIKVRDWPQNAMGILSLDRTFGAEFSELADRVSRSIRELLLLLGAMEAIAFNID